MNNQRIIYQRTILEYLKYNNYLSKVKDCKFCTLGGQQVLHKYTYWTLIRNKFPWKTWKEHNILLLNRHIKNIDIEELKRTEIQEFNEIRIKHPEHVVMHTAPKTIKVDHFHYHLCK